MPASLRQSYGTSAARARPASPRRIHGNRTAHTSTSRPVHVAMFCEHHRVRLLGMVRCHIRAESFHSASSNDRLRALHQVSLRAKLLEGTLLLAEEIVQAVQAMVERRCRNEIVVHRSCALPQESPTIERLPSEVTKATDEVLQLRRVRDWTEHATASISKHGESTWARIRARAAAYWQSRTSQAESRWRSACERDR